MFKQKARPNPQCCAHHRVQLCFGLRLWGCGVEGVYLLNSSHYLIFLPTQSTRLPPSFNTEPGLKAGRCSQWLQDSLSPYIWTLVIKVLWLQAGVIINATKCHCTDLQFQHHWYSMSELGLYCSQQLRGTRHIGLEGHLHSTGSVNMGARKERALADSTVPTWQAAGIGTYDKCQGASKDSSPRKESHEKLQDWLFF